MKKCKYTDTVCNDCKMCEPVLHIPDDQTENFVKAVVNAEKKAKDNRSED